MRITFQLRGLKEVQQRLAALATSGKSAFAGRLYAEAQSILNVARNLTPIDTGFLRQSAFVEIPVINGDHMTVTFGYAAEYAVPVHEDLSVHHKKGSAKFLEIPFRAWQQKGLANLAAGVQAWLSGGTRSSSLTAAGAIGSALSGLGGGAQNLSAARSLGRSLRGGSFA